MTDESRPPTNVAPPPIPTPAAPVVLGGSALIPSDNPSALWAYYLGIVSLVPCIGLFLTVPAILQGRKAIAAHAANPAIHGRKHAIAGIVCAIIAIVLNVGGILVIVAASQL